MTPESGWYFKNGQYAYGKSASTLSKLFARYSRVLKNRVRLIVQLDTPNYTNITRTLLFDDVKWYETDKGEWDGFITVAPSCSIWTPLWCIPYL